MRKNKSLIALVAATALLGAGCGQSEPAVQGLSGQTVADQYGYSQGEAPAKIPSAPTDSPTPEEPATNPQNGNIANPESTPPTSMDSLAFPGVFPESETNVKVRIKTNMGDIVVQLDPKAGPNAASNFVYLVKKGFYNGTIFHRVIDGFMIQGGDPTGTGTGGPGYRFADDKVTGSYAKGTLAMANAGPNTNGSQFFIMVADVPLPPNYSIFGKVVTGQDIADKISLVDRNANDKPLSEVKMLEVTVE
jgi:cyclophilin family peptidyl-prolyl cis-trans isomerase